MIVPRIPSRRTEVLKRVAAFMAVLVGVLLIGFILRERAPAVEIVGTVRDCEVYRIVDRKVGQHVVYVLMCGGLAGSGIAVAHETAPEVTVVATVGDCTVRRVTVPVSWTTQRILFITQCPGQPPVVAER